MRKEERAPENSEQDSTIFNQHQTSASLRQQQKEQQRQERQALIQELADRTGETRGVTRVMSIILAVVVLGCAAVLAFRLWPQPKDRDPDKGHFVSDGTLPELSEEEILMELDEAYYTNDGSLALVLTFSNGADTPKAVTGFSLKAINNNGDVIATGEQAADWDASFTVPKENYASMTVYIPPEDVLLPDDSLYAITVEYTVDDAPVISTIF